MSGSFRYAFSRAIAVVTAERLCIEIFDLTAWSIFWITIACTPVTAQVAFKSEAVSIETADQILRSRTTVSIAKSAKPTPQPSSRVQAKALSASSPATQIGCASNSSQPVEITTLASALKCNIDLIYEYVYNNIEFEPLFGSNKGAVGTLLDQRGNDIDQDQLFVALLNASGITQTSYIYGYITVTGTTTPLSPCTATYIASAPGWLGVKNDYFAIANVLANDGGIPRGNGVYNGIDGTMSCLDIAHVWVQVTIGGTNYVFDPSFKQHTVSTGLTNLGTILGYTQSQFLSDAGGSIDTVSISNINRAAVRSDLTKYANNLVSYIKANNPAFTLKDIIGGKTIIPLTGSPIRQTSIPYLSSTQPTGFPQNWGASVPNAYRTCLAISMPAVTNPQPCGSPTPQTIVLYSDQTYGQRITVFSVADPNISGNYIPTLLVNGVAPTSGTNTGPSTAVGQTWGLYAAVTHPYVFTQDNESKTLSVGAGGSYLVSAGWGQVGRGMVAKHQQLLTKALAAPGADPASEAVLGESLAVISYNWLAENAAQQAIGDALGQVTTQYHHGVGITAQTAIQQSGSQGPYVDLPMNTLSIGQQTCWPSTSCPFPSPIQGAFYNDSGTSSSLESAVLQQTQAPTPNMVAASTIALVDQNAGTGAKTFFADGTSSAGQSNYVNLIRPQLTASYSSADLAAIDIAVTGASPPPGSPTPTQSQVLIPSNGTQTVGLWNGAGYSIISQTSTRLEITQKISGGLSGGFSGTDLPIFAQTLNTSVTIIVPPSFGGFGQVLTLLMPQSGAANPFISEPVDAVTGSEVYTHEDISIGSGAFPYALPFARTYQSSSNLTDIGLGNGWAHSYSLSAQANSDPYAGMGANSPISAAAAIAAIYVSQNLLQNSPQTAQSLTLAWIVDHWFTDQLTNNVTNITRPDTSEEFVALPHLDGASTVTYNPPLASAVVLTGTGSGTGNPTFYTYATKDGVRLVFNMLPSGSSTLPISSWSWPSGILLNFTYNSLDQLITVSNNLGRQLSLSYTNNHVTSVTDGSRTINFGYVGALLTSMTDPIGYQTTFSYDSSGNYDTANRLTQIFYPSAPSNPFVTNFYDPLGHVILQKNANGAAGQFYFAGSRSEIVDASGNREVTYQTPRGKITKYAFVLNASFGDVFNDTAQSNGIVNVTSNQYDGQDRQVLTTAPEGGTTTTTYSPDFEQNVISITRGAKPGSPLTPLTTTFAYDPVYNKPTRVTDPLGLVTTTSYDPATGNALQTVADSGGAGHFNATTRFTYNAVGQVLTMVDPQAMLTTMAYDSFGNSISVVRDCCGSGHLNQTIAATYDGFGNLLKIIDPNGNVTTNTYDFDRRTLTMATPGAGGAPGGVISAYSYDPDGRLLQTQQSANGILLRQTSTTYTLTGKPATTTDANGNVTLSSYDADDRLTSITDPLGRTTVYGYDALNRRVSISNPAILPSTPLLQQTYTPDGLLASLVTTRNNNVFSTTTYAPDGFDRLATTTYPDASNETRGYDADGNVLSRKTRKGDSITFTYDTLNRLVTKAAPSEATVAYTYDLIGRVLGVSDTSAAIASLTTAGTVSAMAMSYDAQNHLLSQSWSPVQAQAPPTASTATFTYAYDGSNRRTSQSTTDNAYWSYPAASASSIAYTVNSLDQYTAIKTTTTTYDANGNLTFDGIFTYGYDAESRLTSVSQGSTAVATYAYDALGRRKSATAGSTTTILVTDPDNRTFLDYDSTSHQLLHWYAVGAGPNDVLGQVNVLAGTRATLVPDVQGSVVASLDSGSGTLTKGGYQPYGEGAGVTAATAFGYTGARIGAGGTYDFKTRFYSPLLGRFLQSDQVGTAGGVNLYAYVGNDPLNLVDLFGTAPDSPSFRVAQLYEPEPVENSPPREEIENSIYNNRVQSETGVNPGSLNLGQTYLSPPGSPKASLPSGGGRSGADFYGTPGGQQFAAPPTYQAVPALNGKGLVLLPPGQSLGDNSNIIRYGDPNASNPLGYFRYYNGYGQPIDPRTGLPGPNSATHIDPGYQGPLLGYPGR